MAKIHLQMNQKDAHYYYPFDEELATIQ